MKRLKSLVFAFFGLVIVSTIGVIVKIIAYTVSAVFGILIVLAIFYVIAEIVQADPPKDDQRYDEEG